MKCPFRWTEIRLGSKLDAVSHGGPTKPASRKEQRRMTWRLRARTPGSARFYFWPFESLMISVKLFNFEAQCPYL